MNLSTKIKEAEERLIDSCNKIDPKYEILCDENYLELKTLFYQELRNLAEDMAKEIVPEEIKQVDGNWDKKPLKEGEEAIYCLTCGAFYYEGACICRAKNNIINEIKQRLETYLK